LPVRPRRCLPRRGEDLIASFKNAAATALREAVDLVIHTGDLFHSPAPSSTAMMAAAEPLMEMASGGIPVVLLGGRHDGGLSQIPLLLAHRNIHWIHQPRTVVLDRHGIRITVTAVPHLERVTPERFAEALKAAGADRAEGDIRILALHQVFESAVRGPLGHRYTGDEVVPRDRLPDGFHYVAAGGAHRHQVLQGPEGTPLVYAGSTDRISFDEQYEPKGGVLAEWADGRMTLRFIEHRVRPMAVLPLDVSGLRRGRIIDRAMESVAALPADTFAELRLTGQSTRTALSAMDLPGRAREIRPDVLLQVAFAAVEMQKRRSARTVRTEGGQDARPPSLAEGGQDARPPGSAFACLGTPPEPLVQASIEDVRLLPRRPGAYCLYDTAGRLLYVGKARDLRTRVRCHLRPGAVAGYFSGWTRHIARVEARPACSELEALLVEVELVRRLRPPFNQQMRFWSRYCYIAPDGRHGRLVIHRRRPKTGPCFGPYRSLGQARRILEAIERARSAGNGERSRSAGLGDLPTIWRAALSGIDDAAMRTLEAQAEALVHESAATGDPADSPTPCGGSGSGPFPAHQFHGEKGGQEAWFPRNPGGQDAHPPRKPGGQDARPPRNSGAQDARPPATAGPSGGRASCPPHGTKREAPGPQEVQGPLPLNRFCASEVQTAGAESLMGGMLVLPGQDETRRLVLITDRGLRFDVLRPDPADAARVLARHRRLTPHIGTAPGPLRRSMADALWLIARHLRRNDAKYALIPATTARELTPQSLLNIATAQNQQERA